MILTSSALLAACLLDMVTANPLAPTMSEFNWPRPAPATPTPNGTHTSNTTTPGNSPGPWNGTIPLNSTNSTLPSNYTICNPPLCIPPTNVTNVTDPTPITYNCVPFYPSKLKVVHSRYFHPNETDLYNTNTLFMLRRQFGSDIWIDTRVQFDTLPAHKSNTTCRLEFVLPGPILETRYGFTTFDVFTVLNKSDDIELPQSWASTSRALLGTVNGMDEAPNKTRANGGVTVLGERPCNTTMAFDVMLRPGSEYSSHWWFLQTTPPAWPIQGFRMTVGC